MPYFVGGRGYDNPPSDLVYAAAAKKARWRNRRIQYEDDRAIQRRFLSLSGLKPRYRAIKKLKYSSFGTGVKQYQQRYRAKRMARNKAAAIAKLGRARTVRNRRIALATLKRNRFRRRLGL